MSDIFNKLKSKSSKAGENNDCTVKAWAIVAGLSYEDAHNDLRSVGRKPGRGIYMQRALQTLCDKRGMRFTKVTDKYPKARTMITAPRVLPNRGMFLIFVNGHVAAYRAGELHDWTVGRKHHVNEIYRINTKAGNAK